MVKSATLCAKVTSDELANYNEMTLYAIFVERLLYDFALVKNLRKLTKYQITDLA